MIPDQLTAVVMDDGTYFKSSRSSSGACVVVRAEYAEEA